MVSRYPRVATAGILGSPQQQQPGLLGGYGNLIGGLLGGLGGAIGNYGGPGGLSQGYAEGYQNILNNQLAMGESKRRERRDTLEEQKLQHEIEAQQREEQETAALTQQLMGTIESLNLPPDVKALATAAVGQDPKGVLNMLGDFMKPQDGVKGTEIAGRLVNPITGEVIKDFSAEEAALRLAGRPVSTTNITTNTGPTGIDYGEPEKGLVWQRNPDGSVALDDRGAPIAIPYQGGPAYIAAEDVANKAGNKQAGKERTGYIVLDEIRRILDADASASLPVTGPIGGALSQIAPGTKAFDVSKLIDPIKANIGFQQLQQLRDQSPTGGALGPVSDVENTLLQSTLGSLSQAQTREQFIYNVKRLNNVVIDIVHGKGNDPYGERMSLDSGASGHSGKKTVINGYTIEE